MSPYTTINFPFIASVNCRRRKRPNTREGYSSALIPHSLRELALLVGRQQSLDVEHQEDFLPLLRNRDQEFSANPSHHCRRRQQFFARERDDAADFVDFQADDASAGLR